jgi:signal peptidase II
MRSVISAPPRNKPMPNQLARQGLMIAAIVVVLDQATKIAVADWLGEVGAGVTVTSFFNLVFALNRGASFGLFNTGSPWGPWLLSGFTVVVVIGLVVWLMRTTERGLGIALGLLIGGAIGNLIDRLYRSAVVDFLDFHIAGFHWWTFNIADSAITIGVTIVLIGNLICGNSGRNLWDDKNP